MFFRPRLTRLLHGLAVIVLATTSPINEAFAIEKNERNASSSFRVGFDGHTRLGSWFPVFVKLDEGNQPNSFEIDSIDADGFPVTLKGQVIAHRSGWLECLMQAGRKHSEFQLSLLTDRGEIIDRSFRLKDSLSGHVVHPSTQALTVVIEPGSSISSTIETLSRVGRSTQSAIVSMKANDLFPSNWIAWQSVKTLVISANDTERLQGLSSDQWNAIEAWVNRGGRLIVSISPSVSQLVSANGPLEVFCPGQFTGTGQIDSSSRVEFYANASEQLIARNDAPIIACQLEDVKGRVELTQDSLPLVISNAKGFGSVTFVSFDLSDQRFTDWKGFSGLVDKIMHPTVDRNFSTSRSRSSTHGNRVSHVGYTDMAGQLRLALDRFSSVSFISFASIATLIALYILCVGAGDYFLLSKLFRRMELTWLTFPLMSLLFCGAAYSVARTARPVIIKMNQLEIIDIDQASNQSRGNIWTHYYSPQSGSCSLELPTTSAIGNSLGQRIVGCQGLPGNGLGGMSTKASNSLVGHSYVQPIIAAPDRAELSISIKDQPLRVSSTRALFSQWWSDTPYQVESNLTLNQRTRHIEGTFINPLDKPLKNCQLLFGEYTYKLPTKLGPGDEIDILGDDLREQTTRSYLNRRTRDQKDANRTTKIPWDPTSTRIDRLAEILMFYSAAGGKEYTGLSHAYQPFVDLTDHLRLSRAILVGELDELITPLQIDDSTTDDAYDSTTTLVRIIFPVEIR